MAPAGMGKALFANSGSEANETAIKLAWDLNNARGRPQQKKIISRQRAYHGVTVATASLTGLAFAQEDFDLPIARILHTDCPHYYRGAKAGESEDAFAARLADSLERLILREGPDTVAAFFAEPVMGAGGVIVPPATYFDRIQPLLKKYDILFVVDEVISGFGRTGNMFGAQTFDLKPDIMTLAKATSARYQPTSASLIPNAQHHGAILRNMPGDVVAFSPPLIISEAEIDEMMACFGRALDDTWAMVREKRLA